MFVSVTTNAMKHNANDSAKLANFLLQPVGGGIFTNADLIFGDHSENWMIDADWISKITSDVIDITWREVNNEKRIKSISTELTLNAPSCLSGTLDMSDCDWLETVNLPVQLLDKVKFDNCKELQDVLLMNNAISSASFSNCESLEAVNLDGNRLLLSKIKFPSTTSGKFDILSQTITNPSCSVDVLNNELYLLVDLRDEIKANNLILDWGTSDAYLEKEPGLYYLKADTGYSTNKYPTLYINGNGDNKIGYEAICSFNDFPGVINIAVNTPKEKATVNLYLRKENTIAGANVLSYDPIEEKYFATLPQADYIIKVSAEGYYSSYYSDDQSVVANWKKATPVPIGNGANPNIEIRLTEVTVPIGRVVFRVEPPFDNSTIVLYEKITDHEINPVDTIIYTDDAYYSKELHAGNYIAAVYNPDYQFTYYSTDEAVVANWQRASVIPIEESGDVVAWVWLHQKSVLSGNISISGRLKEPSSKLKAAARPFKNATVLLSSSSETTPPIVSTIADEETGEYSFANLPSGIYNVSVEIAGFTSENITINAQTGNGQYVNNDFIINGNTKTVTTDIVSATPEMKNIELAIYPNPVTDVVRISGLEGAYTIKVISLLGQTVISTTGTSPEPTLNLSGQPSGLYLVRIETQGKLITRKLIKK